ncbi:MAG TPA: uroporphyrinogen decarboxylase family protein [Candidatus Limnocylindrales bacterium]|nr:uroporphyrinogen decarboxylase family protein [Candidatus Limnocylindrales bacterium]
MKPTKTMTSRERLLTTLNHRQPDRVCVDFGGTYVTGIHTSIVHQLKQRLIGPAAAPTRVHEPYQMLGEVDAELRAALGADVTGVWSRKNIFGYEANGWKPFTLFDGTPCLVPGNFNVTPAPDGGWLMYPQGDTSVPSSGHMPKGAYFFDAIIRQEPLDEDHLNPEDNLEEFGLLTAEDIAYYEQQVARLDQDVKDTGIVLMPPGTAFGDIALVPGPFLKHPKGIRDISEWYMATAAQPHYVHAVFEKQCEYALKNLETLIAMFGDRVQVLALTGTDFGTQNSLFISIPTYRDLFKPYHQKLNDLVHRKSSWKTFIHSCGAIAALIPDFIEAGFDILNPVQCSAAGMDPVQLKRNFGKDITFWGGCVNTQHTMYQTPEAVYREVRERIDIFNRDGGYVCNSIHNVQGNSPIENVLAMFRAIRDSGQA